ncbi:hypothetical protein NPIL_290371 [Nephila pilipes]|uniref:Uncharacterized protein n=1 Tax=Nephila pilipes TaxID=299642 RepID=A0A8X6U9I3_NEPPI|nr:hypothetical protein NPIL_290371 [Nephila pilipes]
MSSRNSKIPPRSRIGTRPHSPIGYNSTRRHRRDCPPIGSPSVTISTRRLRLRLSMAHSNPDTDSIRPVSRASKCWATAHARSDSSES